MDTGTSSAVEGNYLGVLNPKKTTEMIGGKKPPGCLYAEQKIGKSYACSVYLMQWEPGKRALYYRAKRAWGASRKFRRPSTGPYVLTLMMPRIVWMVGLLNHRSGYLAPVVIKEPFEAHGLETEVFYAPLPNQRENHSMCTGSFRDAQQRTGTSDNSQVMQIMRFLDSSVWNDDLPYGFHIIHGLRFKGLADWEKRTQGKTADALWKRLDPRLTQHRCKTLAGMLEDSFNVMTNGG